MVALGLDASEHDPLGGLAVTTPGFRRIGAAIARMGLPTVFVQEGGYLSDILGANLAAVLGDSRRRARRKWLIRWPFNEALVMPNVRKPALPNRQSSGLTSLAVTPADVIAAAATIRGSVIVTECNQSRTLSEICGCNLWLKFENLQFTSSFKERGALNRLARAVAGRAAARRRSRCRPATTRRASPITRSGSAFPPPS